MCSIRSTPAGEASGNTTVRETTVAKLSKGNSNTTDSLRLGHGWFSHDPNSSLSGSPGASRTTMPTCVRVSFDRALTDPGRSDTLLNVRFRCRRNFVRIAPESALSGSSRHGVSGGGNVGRGNLPRRCAPVEFGSLWNSRCDMGRKLDDDGNTIAGLTTTVSSESSQPREVAVGIIRALADYVMTRP